MKKILLGSMIALSFQANAFMMNAECNYNSAHGECSVINNTPNPIRCSLHIDGRTASGATGFANEVAVLYPNQYAYAYINANNPALDPLVYVNGYANCKSLY
jgi:hypothetical protein